MTEHSDLRRINNFINDYETADPCYTDHFDKVYDESVEGIKKI